MTRAPIIGSVNRGSQDVGRLLTTIGQGSLNRLSNAFLQNQRIQASAAQAAAQRANQRQMQATAIGAAQQQQEAQIDAQAQSQKALAGEQTRRIIIGAGLQEEVATKAFERDLQMEHEKARNTAAQYEQKFTMEQRILDANLARSEQVIKESDTMTPEQKELALFQVKQSRLSNADPVDLLGEAGKTPMPEGKEFGMSWPDEFGNVVARMENGEERIVQDYGDTRQGVEATRKYDAGVAAQEAEVKRQGAEDQRAIDLEERKLDSKMKLMEMSAKLKTIDEGGEERFYTPREQQDWVRGGMKTLELGEGAGDWAADLAEVGINVTEREKGMGPELGSAHASIVWMLDRAEAATGSRDPRGILREDEAMYDNASKIINRHRLTNAN